jgi:hypothetical protein
MIRQYLQSRSKENASVLQPSSQNITALSPFTTGIIATLSKALQAPV